MDKVLIEVHIVTYNQEAFIQAAIESVITQECTYPFKIIIGDDGSDDGTKEIIQKYKDQFPSRIETLILAENKGPKNHNRVGIQLLRKVNAKYVCLLDGDDYWTDPKKLQKQVDLLEKRPDIAGVFHDVVNVDENGEVIKEKYHKTEKEEYNQMDALEMGSAYATCSLVFRSKVLKPFPKWLEKDVCDFTLDLQITEYGKLAYIPETMAAYRIHSGGMWQGTEKINNKKIRVDRYRRLLRVPNFRKKYKNYLGEKIAEISSIVAGHYAKQNNSAKWKYIWYYLKYKKPLGINDLKLVLGTFISPGFYKKIKQTN